MDVAYEKFCLADPVFYDSPARVRTGPAEALSAGRVVPHGWVRHENPEWVHLTPTSARLPAQGWKVHVSATPANAVEVLDAVWGYCLPRALPFKFLPDLTALLLRNGKYADRGGSGKFITIYPASTGELEQLLDGLGAALDGQPGPYILNDLRWGAGPLHVRYGAFRRRFCRAPGGERVPAIADPTGRLVPDFRGPYFEVPPWAPVPDFLAERIRARLRDEQAPADFPYTVARPLHFSNGGGVYLATDTRTGRRVVLREARPHAGLDATGRDAVRRLEREQEVLEKLAGTGVVPELYERFTCWEHHFLAEEYVEGATLGRMFVDRYPLIHPEATEADVAEYTAWALDVLDRVREGLRVVHDHGIAFGDLHPHNVIVRPDGQIRFVDFEAASYTTDEQRPGLGAPGFAPPDGRRGTALDRYALACLRVAAFLPLTVVFPLAPDKPRALVETIARRFPVPASYAPEVLAELRPTAPPGRIGALADALDAGDGVWPVLRASLHRGILAGATPERDDRLFPGDIRQFTGNGVGFAHGAAGVLHVLNATGAGRHPEHEDWLLDAVWRGQCGDAVGFFDGLHGVAYALEALGRRDDALTLLDGVPDTALDTASANLFDGLAGIGLNLLHFAGRTGAGEFRARALDVADRLVDCTAVPPDPSAVRRAGLMHGPSGHALFLLRLFEATGDRQFLDLAETALRRDLDRAVALDDGTVQVDEGFRVMPYVATGSAGTGFVLDEFLRHRPDEELAGTLRGIARAATPEFVIGCGLFNGRAGLIAFLARLRDTGRVEHGPVVERHLRRLSWHLLDHRGHAAFPGDQLLRLSMDVATGSAGILLAVAAALDGDHATFPFLSPWEGVTP